MKHLDKLSNEYLEKRKTTLENNIYQAEKDLAQTKSFLFRVSIMHTIKSYKTELHLIEAEICYRNNNTK